MRSNPTGAIERLPGSPNRGLIDVRGINLKLVARALHRPASGGPSLTVTFRTFGVARPEARRDSGRSVKNGAEICTTLTGLAQSGSYSSSR